MNDLARHTTPFRTALPAAAAFCLIWGMLIWHLSTHWSVNPQYSFGWFVPAISAALAFRRWQIRPAPGASGPWSGVMLALGALAYVPAWAIAQPNPDWRLISWLLCASAIVMTLAAVHMAGGRPWVGHFAFPVLFILTAIPWPAGIETTVIQALMRTVAAVTVEVLNALAIPAVQHGNAIEIGTGLLGVDDACSGVRSLQASVMAALFLGEWYGLRAVRRIAFVVAGIAIAFAGNCVRSVFLARSAARDGLDSVQQWHDPAGYTVLAACFLVLWIWALRSPSTPRGRATVPPSAPPRLAMTALAAWIALGAAGTEAWFRAHGATPPPAWSMVWPETESGFQNIPIPNRAADLLLYDHARGATWTAPDRVGWTAFFFRWNAGPARSRILARMHRPDVCLPAAGVSMREDRGTVVASIAGLEIPFRAYVFEENGAPLHVFYALWQDGQENDASGGLAQSSRLASLQSVLQGRRRLGQQVLEVVLTGCPSSPAADDALRTGLARIIRR